MKSKCILVLFILFTGCGGRFGGLSLPPVGGYGYQNYSPYASQFGGLYGGLRSSQNYYGYSSPAFSQWSPYLGGLGYNSWGGSPFYNGGYGSNYSYGGGYQSFGGFHHHHHRH